MSMQHDAWLLYVFSVWKPGHGGAHPFLPLWKWGAIQAGANIQQPGSFNIDTQTPNAHSTMNLQKNISGDPALNIFLLKNTSLKTEGEEAKQVCAQGNRAPSTFACSDFMWLFTFLWRCILVNHPGDLLANKSRWLDDSIIRERSCSKMEMWHGGWCSAWYQSSFLVKAVVPPAKMMPLALRVREGQMFSNPKSILQWLWQHTPGNLKDVGNPSL